ncbi:MAG TPA: hypothetical protein VFB58_13525 [Chloroflexota bacterium]|nr:hypothetical protein [Chloroflexota bacterium]
MRVIEAEAIEAAARSGWPALIDAADRALTALARGGAMAPLRTSLELDGGTLLTMPGRLAGEDAVVKLVSVMPGNVERPTIQGVAVHVDARDGRVHSIFDGSALTAVRTAAITAAAARRVDARAGTLALLGSGAQAPWQARALGAVCPLHTIRIWSPRVEHRQQLAATLHEDMGMAVRASASVAEAVSGADVVVCATAAEEPFLHADLLDRFPCTVIAIGAYRPNMAEFAPDVAARARRIYADDVSAVLHEAGDVQAAITAGAVTPQDVLPIGGITEMSDAPVRLVKTVGSAAEDAAVAMALDEMV